MSDRDGRARPAYGIALPPRPVPSSDTFLAVATHAAGGVLAVGGLSANLVVLVALLPSLALLLASRRPEQAWRRDEARRALNFQLTWVVVTLLLQGAGVLLAILFVNQGRASVGVGFFAVFLLFQSLVTLFDLAVSVVAAVRARRGGGFRDPLRLDLVK
ncbi:MAG: DUF4870 domain-containing protein [Amnibacterium sp.]